MELIRGVHNLRNYHYGCVLTIGNFDGFHRGHQELISKLQFEAYRRGLPVMVMIFEPQPQEYFAGISKSARVAPTRITQLRDKLKYLEKAKVDSTLCITFNKQFAEINAYKFVKELLIKKLGMHLISIGDDFRFGVNRSGDFNFLRKMGKDIGFEVINAVTYTEYGQRISSTAVRKELMQNHLINAEMLLGHPYQISGRVVQGNALGRTIGFPTANIYLKKHIVPINGVYAVEVNGITRESLPGIVNIGIRPTFNGQHQKIEVHLIDNIVNLYGHYIEIVIRTKIREEKQFISLDQLRQQIIIDILHVRKFFGLKLS